MGSAAGLFVRSCGWVWEGMFVLELPMESVNFERTLVLVDVGVIRPGSSIACSPASANIAGSVAVIRL